MGLKSLHNRALVKGVEIYNKKINSSRIKLRSIYYLSTLGTPNYYELWALILRNMNKKLRIDDFFSLRLILTTF